jgi:phenylglyoxylate dehydrogenase beta subunit
VGKAYKTIEVIPELCDGCRECVAACLKVNGLHDPDQSRIKLVKRLTEPFFAPAICLQCGEPACAAECPTDALVKNYETGIVGWNADDCNGCMACTAACEYGGIESDPVTGLVAKCDQCGGQPACVAACKPGALRFRHESDIFNRVGDLEDLFVANSCCVGCNLEVVMRHVLRRVGPNCVVAAPPGCVPGVGTVGVNGRTCTKVPSFHPLLTNTASMLAGTRRYYRRIGRKVTMLALAGDGGTADVGFQSLSGAAERGEEILYVCIDNEGYMNTGAQRSGTTPFGAWTSTTPVGEALRGKTRDQKYMPLIMVMHKCEYVATVSVAFLQDFYEKLDKALEASERGMAYLHVFSPCVSGWRYDSAKTMAVQRMAVAANVFPLWEYENPTGHIRFTEPVDHPVPVERYLSMLGKFRHLNREEIAHVQRIADERIAVLGALARLGDADHSQEPRADRL